MKTFLLSVWFLGSLSVWAQPNHDAFTDVLRSHVRSGRVDYASIKKDARFAPYLASLSATKASELRGAELKAFWINVYNAYTIKLVCDNFPLRSIRDLAKGAVWDRAFITIDGTVYSLNDIENDILRPLGDNRIHYALVCAARSCAPLRSEAYTAENLNEQLTEQARLFVNDTTKNTFNVSEKKAALSRVFEWYLQDFGTTYADLLTSLARYLPEDTRSTLQANARAWSVEWKEYDWSLNGK